MEREALIKMYELERAKVLILRETEGALFSFSNTHIKLENKDEVRGQLQELGVNIESLKLRSDIDKILYVLLQGKE